MAERSMTELSLRRATLGDARVIADIYNHYVATSTATFDTEPKTHGERIAWLTSRGDDYPVFVAEKGGEVVGWGTLSPYRERPAWRPTAEVAIYLSPGHCGAGIGRALLQHLVEAARHSSLHVLVAQVVTENTASLALFDRTGFDRVGTLREVGWKFDRQLDVVLFQLLV